MASRTAAHRIASCSTLPLQNASHPQISRRCVQRAQATSSHPAIHAHRQPFSIYSPLSQQAAAKPASTSSYSKPASSPSSTTSSSPPSSTPSTERPPTTTRTESANPRQPPIQDLLRSGLADGRAESSSANAASDAGVDWTSSFSGLSAEAFAPEVAQVLLAPLAMDDVEVKPDGIVYLPEIKYRRILNRAFGPGGWGLAPRGETIVTSKTVTREYALVARGRLISIARGEQAYFEPDGIPTATEGCKSNALMRCCKDLGIASELWDPRWIRRFLREHTKDVWVEHVVTKKKRKVSVRKDDEVRYPYAVSKAG